jgi:hypothetical protein
VQTVPATQWLGEAQVGYYVRVSGVLQTDGVVVATSIETSQVELNGVIEQITPAGWVVGKVLIQVLPGTRVEGLAVVGSRVTIQAVMLADHGLLARNVLVISTPAGAATPTPQVDPS